MLKLWMGKSVPLELQSERNECGLACLAMVAGSFDPNLDLSTLRRQFGAVKSGLSLKTIANYAQQMGLLVRALRTEPERLGEVKTPAILHWNMDHFVVLVAVKSRGCVIHDPARGRELCSWSELDKHFTGVLLELWPGQDFQPEVTPAAKLRVSDLFSMVRHSGRTVVWVFLLTLALQLLLLAAPWHVQWTVDEALMSGDKHLIGVLCVGFAMLLVLRSLTHWLRGIVIIHLGHSLSFQLACRLLRHLMHLPLDWFERRHVGDITSRFGSLGPVRELLTQGAAAACVDILVVALSLIVMFVYSVELTLLVLVVHLVYLLVYLGFVPRLKRLSLGGVVAGANEQTHLLETVRAIHSVKVYTQEGNRYDQWQKLHATTLQNGVQLQRSELAAGLIGQILGGIELIAIIYLAAFAVLDGVFTVGMLFAYLSYRGHFTERLHSLIVELVELRTLQVHLNRLAEIWAQTPELELKPNIAGGDELIPDKLSLIDVNFAYDKHSDLILRDIELSILPGEFVAIVGPSGAGKSTLLKLLMGLMQPNAGTISFGSQRLNAQNCASYRQQIGCVLQEDCFFNGSVIENVAGFRPVDYARLQAVLGDVGMLQELNTMPMGINSQIGDIGSGFSSGQIQRLLLARALYQSPSYLFLDEGTANLDVASAQAIHKMVRQLDCTRVAITHDLRFASYADRVFVLSAGILRQVDASQIESLQLETDHCFAGVGWAESLRAGKCDEAILSAG